MTLLLLMVTSGGTAHAGLRLAAGACPGDSGSSSRGRLDCDPDHDKVLRLFGSIDLDVRADSVIAVENIIDIDLEGASELAPFWHFDGSGCNTGALAAFYTRPSVECRRASSSLCGPRGGACVGGISAIVARPGDKQNRVQVSFAIARRADDPVTLAPRTPHFVFELDIVTDRARSCSGCNAHAVVRWKSATLYGPTDYSFSGHGSMVLTDSTAKVDVNGDASSGRRSSQEAPARPGSPDSLKSR